MLSGITRRTPAVPTAARTISTAIDSLLMRVRISPGAIIVYTLIAPGEILTRISSESVAVEIVRSIVGTAGVLLVMPLSTAAAILVGVGEER